MMSDDEIKQKKKEEKTITRRETIILAIAKGWI